MLASYHGHAPLVKLLLQFGANPNILNDRGQSPLAGAVFKNEVEVVEVGIPISSIIKLRSRHSKASDLCSRAMKKD
jgi:ankyrin repeat protein